jgi:tripartite-type tricarboxylate transporter receptor subunit TctC
MIDLISGQVDVHFDQLTSSMSFIRSGKVRALAVTTKNARVALPEVPTLEEAGVPGFRCEHLCRAGIPGGHAAGIRRHDERSAQPDHCV